MGELKRLTRLVQRRQLKEQVTLLKQIISTHEPLVKAREITQKAFEEGVRCGVMKAIKDHEDAESEARRRESNNESTASVIEPDLTPVTLDDVR